MSHHESTNFTHINGQDSLLIVPIKIRFDETYQFAAGSANVCYNIAQQFAETSEK